MAVEAPFVPCPNCEGRGRVLEESAENRYLHCEECHGTGKVYKLPDPLRPVSTEFDLGVLVFLAVVLVGLAWFLLKGFWP